MSFFESASLVFISDFAAASASIVSGSGTSTGKAYNIKPVEELGSELIVNGDFATDSDWTKGTGWTISGGTANCDGTQTSSSQLKTSVGISIQNTLVKFSFEVKNYSAGNLIATIEGTGGNEFSNINSDGIYTIETTSTDSTPRITFTANSSFVGSIDNVSVKEVITPLADFDFERGSDITATRVNSSGLIEKGRTNIILDSNDFSTGNYTRSGETTVTPNQPGFDGTNSATLYEAPNGGDRIYQTLSPSLNSGAFTVSLFASRSSGDCDLRFRVVGGSSKKIQQAFNLATGEIRLAVGDTSAFIAASSSDAGNGYKRISLTLDSAQLSGISQVQLITTEIGTNSSNATGSVSIQNLQLEAGLVPTNYINTGATQIRAGILEDEPRFDYHNSASATPNTCPSLLLEPSRENLIPHSEYFGVYSNDNSTDEPNATTSPEGLANATSFLEAATTGQHKLTTSLSFDGSSTYTFSIFAKTNGRDLFIDTQNSNEWGGRAWFDLTNGTANAVLGTANIENFGNGWYRCIVTGESTLAGGNFVELLTSDGSTNSTVGDVTKGVYVYGSQMEEGSYSTSYIPTNGTAATRGDDYYSNTSLSNIGSTDECTFYCEIDLPQGREGSDYFFRFDSPASSFGWKGNYIPSPIISVIGTGNITTSDTINLPTGVHKLIVRWENGVGSIFIDGAKKTEQVTSSTTEVFDEFRSQGEGYRHLQKAVAVFPEALSDTDCEILTGATTYSSFAAIASALNYTVYE